MLDCKQVLLELSNYLDDEISPELKRALEQHLSACRRCSLIFDTARKTLKIITDVGPLEVPLEANARLRARLQGLLERR